MKIKIKIEGVDVDPSLITEKTQIKEYLEQLRFTFPVIIDKISLLSLNQLKNG